ncbi:MAG: hypothetical protein KGK08_04635 [Acidobacteriota bacterium]|nr:hypothetical protein [Acidobacteriota bacterium]
MTQPKGRPTGAGRGAKATRPETRARPARAAPRPKQCRTYTRKRMAEALPEIVDTFLELAKQGSVAHTKTLANLGGLDKTEVATEPARRRRSVAGALLEALRPGTAAGQEVDPDGTIAQDEDETQLED